MASDLFVGRLDEFDAVQVESVAKRLGIGVSAAWRDCANGIASISVMNVASLSLFNQYAAGLEGLAGADAMGRTRFLNLPWWLASLWLPLSFEPLREPLSRDDPVFVGSCQQLLAELTEIRRLSTLDLGSVPDEYHVMRANYAEWWKGLLDPNHAQEPYSEADTIRWIWRGLHDGAQLAVQHDAPLQLAA